MNDTRLDREGKRYSLDVFADSSYDAAHLYLTHVRGNPGCGFPIPTSSTLFEVVADGRISRVPGARLKTWIESRRQEWKGPRGLPSIFSRLPATSRLPAGSFMLGWVQVIVILSTRDRILTLVTPVAKAQDERVRRITIQNIYERFAQMKIRNNIRMIFATYPTYKEVAASYGDINDRISNMVIKTFGNDHVPLKLQDVQLSNVKQDPAVFKAQNDLAAAEAQADAITKIGEAIRWSPEYRDYMKWQSLKEIAATGTQKGTNTLIVVDGAPGSWAQAAYARGK